VNLRVILADDHPFVLLGIRAALDLRDGVTIVGEARAPAALIQLLQATACDVLVTDLTMPDETGAFTDGLSLVRRIRDEWPEVRVVVMTALTNRKILRAIAADGGVSLLGKQESMNALWRAIESGARGEGYLGRSILEALDGPDEEISEAVTVPRLSHNQMQVIRYFVKGQSIAEIAAQLNCHCRTVGRLKREAMRKIGVANDPGLFAYVRARGADSI
jgi:two-component system capsular synthesis response regulator RcsB